MPVFWVQHGLPLQVTFIRVLVLSVRPIPTAIFRTYANARTDGLAAAGNAPKIFLKTTKKGLPWVAVTFCALFSCLGFMSVSQSAGTVFQYFANMTSVAGLITWFGISITYLRFYAGLKAQGIDRKKLPFYSKTQPYAAWYVLVSTFLICLVSVCNVECFSTFCWITMSVP